LRDAPNKSAGAAKERIDIPQPQLSLNSNESSVLSFFKDLSLALIHLKNVQF